MSPIFELTGPSAGPLQEGRPKHLVILLHGYGANGDDLIGLAPVWAPVLPDTLFLAPNAPYPCDMNPFGFQWFGISNLQPDIMLAGARGVAPTLDAYITAAMARHDLDESKTALVGFSQGTMMALHVGLRRANPFAGILGYSGALPGAAALREEMQSRPPVLLIHGDADPMVPVQALHLAEQQLQALKVPVQTHVCPGLEHGIDEAGVELGARFLMKALA
ncbi:MAG: alpha/beta hydrolase [Reyranellaceae bacterium]